MRLFAGSAAVAWMLSGAADAQDAGPGACSMALALGLDISISVDAGEYAQQRDGLAAALLDPAVRDAILAQPGAVALMAYEWSGTRQQAIIAPWSYIDDEADLAGFVAALAGHPRSNADFPTAVGGAIGFGATMLDAVPWCARLVLDISGDGVGNDGYPPETAYRHFPVDGVMVNGLVVEGSDRAVERYYLDHVIRGPGAFVEVAGGYRDYARAMRLKLLRELQLQYSAR
jgi:hypothetical protein